MTSPTATTESEEVPPVEDLPVRHQQAGELPWYTHKPVSILVITITLVMAVTSFAVLAGWARGMTVEALRPPLLLLGMCVIAVATSLTRGGATAVLTILIVGVLVAPENYLLRIAHMIARPDRPFEDYAKKYDGEGNVASLQATEDITNRVVEALRSRGVKIAEPDATALNRVITSERVRLVAARTMAEDAQTPLRWVVTGGQALADVVRRYADLDYFQHDMRFLRTEGLIEFPDNTFAAATATDLGKQVWAELSNDYSHFSESEFSSPFEVERPSPDEMLELSIGGASRQASFESAEGVKWFKFNVPEEGLYVIDVVATDGDPVARLFGPDGFDEIAEDDDSGGDLNAQITKRLASGMYYLGIRNLIDSQGTFEITVNRRSSADP